MPRLEHIDGTHIVDDVRVGHTLIEVGALSTFIDKQNPTTFIEIGVHEGGLSYILIPVVKCEYIGIEINCNIVRPKVKKVYNSKSNAQLCCMDCFGFDCYELVSNKQNKIIYCDGGNKPKELKHFMGACKVGDIIMAHDFYDGTRKVTGVKKVRPEVTAQDIQIFETNPDFERIGEYLFRRTRIIAWKRRK